MYRMLARWLLFAALAAPLCAQGSSAQDSEVTKYLEELRARRQPPRDVKAMQRQALAATTRTIEETSDPRRKAEAYAFISQIEQNLEEPDAALAAARQAHELAPEETRFTMNLARMLAAGGQNQEAAALLGVDPADGAALLRRAQELASRPGDIEMAQVYAQLALKVLPDDPALADTVGNIYIRTAKPDQAIVQLNRAIANAPAVAAYHYDLAVAFFQKDYVEYAEGELQAALACHPTDDERQRIQDLLAHLRLPPVKQ